MSELSSADRQRLFEDFLRDVNEAVLRLEAHRELGVPLREEVDEVASRARHLFDAIHRKCWRVRTALQAARSSNTP
jgi:hypothetical protein